MTMLASPRPMLTFPVNTEDRAVRPSVDLEIDDWAAKDAGANPAGGVGEPLVVVFGERLARELERGATLGGPVEIVDAAEHGVEIASIARRGVRGLEPLLEPLDRASRGQGPDLTFCIAGQRVRLRRALVLAGGLEVARDREHLVLHQRAAAPP